MSANRHGLVASAMVTTADGHAAIEITLGADKGYDAKEFIDALQEMKVTPHVAQNTSGRKSAVPDEIATTVGYGNSQQKRKLIEQGFGWAKAVGTIRQVMVRGMDPEHSFALAQGVFQQPANQGVSSLTPGLGIPEQRDP